MHDSEDETARRQIREDYDERQEEVNYGIYPIVVQRGKPVAAVPMTWWQRVKRFMRG